LRGDIIARSLHWGGALYAGYFFQKDAQSGNVYKFATITDMDQLSRIKDEEKPTFRSVLLPGTLTREGSNLDDCTYKIELDKENTRELISKHNEAGRGMELSELTLYANRLLAFDDRTGSVFEILNEKKGTSSIVAPRYVLTEGEGDTDKGMKWEWATVKDGNLYLGSMGKEYSKPDGSIANINNLWIVIISPDGQIQRVDWSDQYNFVRKKLDCMFPGYVMHEAILWSDQLKKWVFLPRRISQEAYDENKDERKGSNKVILVDEKFKSAKIVEIAMADLDPLHGFSTFAFVPGTGDKHAIAVRSVEEDCVGGDDTICKQRSYVIVFDVLSGKVLMDEVQIGLEMKFEGIEFVDIYTPEPAHATK